MSKNKMKSKISIVALCMCIALLLCTSIFVFFHFENTNVALAADTNTANLEELAKAYTDSDTIYGMQKSIREYPSALYQTKARVSSGKLVIDGDDPIVNVIPRAYFVERGEHLYIGKEYGFFVNSYAQSSTSKNNIVEILVFDISTNTDLEKTTDRLIVRVEPIFQYYYAYVNGSEKYVVCQETLLSIDYSINSTANYIAPLPKQNKKFEAYDKYYLKDISFGALLQNEQELNTSNEQYQPEQDDGAFIIGQDYTYKGVWRDKDKLSDAADDLATSASALIVDTIGFAFGVASIFTPPPINYALGIFSCFTGFLAVGNDIQSIVDNANNLPPAETEVTSGKITAMCKYTTRREQLAHYVDEVTRKPALTKVATIIVEGNDDKGNLWYNVGSYAEGCFTISDSATTDPWYTRCRQEIALSVVDKNGNEHINHGIGTNFHMLREPIYKEVKMGENKTLSFLYEGDNFFKFTPQFNGTYNITFDKTFDFAVTVKNGLTGNPVKITPQSNVYKYNFVKGKTYYLQIHSPLGDVVNMNIEPVYISTEQSIPMYFTCIYSYKATSTGLVTFASSQTNAKISNIYQKGANGGTENVPQLGIVKESRFIEAYVKAGQTYYVILHNTTSSSLSSKVTVTPLNRTVNATTATGNSVNLDANDNYKYYSFTPTASGDYHFTFENSMTTKYSMSFYCFNKEGDVIPMSAYIEGYLLLNGLQKGTTYYIGVSSTQNMYVTPKFTKSEVKYQWKYRTQNKWIEIASDTTSIKLTRGQTYEFGFFVNGLMAQNYSTNIADTKKFIVDTNKPNRIKIDSTTLHLSNCVINAKFEGAEGLNYAYNLTVFALFDSYNLKISDDVNYDNATILSINLPTGVVNWTATLKGKDNKGASFTCNYKNKNTAWYNVFDDLKIKNALGDATFTIISATVRSALDSGEETIPINATKTISATHSGLSTVNGKTIYHIGNALQFYNIRFDQSCGRILDNDITLDVSRITDIIEAKVSWIPIPTLECDINGNSKTITNFNMALDSYDYGDFYGLVGVNNATIIYLTLKNFSLSFGYEATPSTWKFAGAFAGQNNGTIQQCKAFGSIHGYRDLMAVGGFAGRNNGYIFHCDYGGLNESASVVYGWSDVGGICGHSGGTVTNCRTLNTNLQQRLYGTSASIGGIVAYGTARSIITNCTVEVCTIANVNDVKIKSLKPKMGVIVGHMVEGHIRSVGQRDVTCSTGTVDSKSTTYCFNGSWPFYGKLENCNVDGNAGQWGP
ncbi:MAG: hypothetical protein K2G31_04945 [Clostridia bacterium]|nr:hypothetical protein [Clostridia bacterium]